MALFNQFYERVLSYASHRQAPLYLGSLSFAEAIILPIPPDFLLVPMALANKEKAWQFAWITTVTSVLGGIVGYMIGVYLYDTVGRWVVELYGLQEYFGVINNWYDEYGIWMIFIAGFLPIPYKVFTIASGVFAMALLPFVVGSTIGRATRFFAVAAICYWAGQSIHKLMKKYANRIGWSLSFILVAGLVYWSTK